MLRWAVLLAALVAAAVGAGLVLSQRADRLAGTNSVLLGRFVATIPPGGDLCQGPEVVPADTARLGLFVGTFGRAGGPLAVRVGLPGRTVTTGVARPGFRDGELAVPLGRVDRTVGGATVCVRNRGGGRVTVGGLGSSPGQAARVDGRPSEGRLRLEYLRPGRESWWQLAGTVAHRFGILKEPFHGAVTLWLAAGLLAAAWLVALGAVLRSGRA